MSSVARKCSYDMQSVRHESCVKVWLILYYFAELATVGVKMAYKMGDSQSPGKVVPGRHHSVTVKVSEAILVCIFTGMKTNPATN